MVRQNGKLDLDPATVRHARSLARKAGRPIVTLAKKHTTVAVERATLRLAGLGGADEEGSGLRGLTDRVESLGGTLTLESPPGGGTRLAARVPLGPITPVAPARPRRASA